MARLPLENCVVLHVDDDDAAAYILRAALDEAGLKVNVYRVTDGEQALLFLKRQGVYEKARIPKLVLLDLNMPKVNGWQVLEERQRNSALQAVPFIVMSTGPAEQHAPEALAAGAQHYIEKPGDFEELVRQVRTHCEPFVTSKVA